MKLLEKYGGELVEFPITENPEYEFFDMRANQLRYMPEIRRGKLKRALRLTERPLRVLEAHNGITGLIVENAKVEKDDEIKQFDAICVSSLCDSTAKV